jgi:hypothetical protein
MVELACLAPWVAWEVVQGVRQRASARGPATVGRRSSSTGPTALLGTAGSGSSALADHGPVPLRMASASRPRPAPRRPGARRPRDGRRPASAADGGRVRERLVLATIRGRLPRRRVPALAAWLDTNDPIIQGQFARRGFRTTRPKNMPLTTGGLEQRLRPVRDAIHPRRHALKNRERTNRLLMLMQLHANGDASESSTAKSSAIGWPPTRAARAGTGAPSPTPPAHRRCDEARPLQAHRLRVRALHKRLRRRRHRLGARAGVAPHRRPRRGHDQRRAVRRPRNGARLPRLLRTQLGRPA